MSAPVDVLAAVRDVRRAAQQVEARCAQYPNLQLGGRDAGREEVCNNLAEFARRKAVTALARVGGAA